MQMSVFSCGTIRRVDSVRARICRVTTGLPRGFCVARPCCATQSMCPPRIGRRCNPPGRSRAKRLCLQCAVPGAGLSPYGRATAADLPQTNPVALTRRCAVSTSAKGLAGKLARNARIAACTRGVSFSERMSPANTWCDGGWVSVRAISCLCAEPKRAKAASMTGAW